MPKISQLTTTGTLNGTENVPLQIGSGNGKTTLTNMKDWLETVLQTGSNVTVDDSAPTDASEGDLWYDSSSGGLYVWVNGSTNAWIQTNGGGQGGGGGASVTVSSTAPADPVEGDLWYDDTNAILYVYVAGTTNAWVQAGGGSGGGSGAGNWSTGWVNTDGTNTVTAGATLTFDHNLGTTDVTTQIWAADDANGTNAFQPINLYESSYGSNAPWNVGTSVTSITTTSVSITIAEDSFAKWSNSGNAAEVTSTGKYIKVVVSAGGGGTSGGGSGGSTAKSGPQTITLNSEIPFNHGFGDHPDLVEGYLTCTQAEFGYQPGDRLLVSSNYFSDGTPASSQDHGVSFTTTTTQAIALIGEDIEIPSRTTPGTSPSISSDGIGLTNWKLEIVAIKFSGGGSSGGGGPRAYVVFNGAAGSPTSIANSITDSLNVDSITTSGTGEYHVNLSTPITNPKLVVSPIMQYSSGSYQHDTDVAAIALPHDSNGLGATTTSQIRVETYYNAGADVGAPVHLLVF